MVGEFWLALFTVGLLLAFAAYLCALSIRLYAVVDTIWTGGLGLAALSYYFIFGPETLRAVVALVLMLLWSSRLTLHLVRDRILAGKEDPRYEALEKHWGDDARVRFLFLFLGQVPLVALFILPFVMAVNNTQSEWRVLDTVGVVIAVVALIGEFAADRQLALFRANPNNKGGVCQRGLWRYSRHPNYFFEWLYWFSYVAFATGAEWGWLSLTGPVMMYLFLRYITGVPFAERSSLKSRGDAYREYQKTTNTFFPWKPQ